MSRSTGSNRKLKRQLGPLSESKDLWTEEGRRDALAGFTTVLVAFFVGTLFGAYLAFTDPEFAEWLLAGWYVYLIVAVSIVLGAALVFGYHYVVSDYLNTDND